MIELGAEMPCVLMQYSCPYLEKYSLGQAATRFRTNLF